MEDNLLQTTNLREVRVHDKAQKPFQGGRPEMKFPGYRVAPDESGSSARFIGRSSVARRFIIGRGHIASWKPMLSARQRLMP